MENKIIDCIIDEADDRLTVFKAKDFAKGGDILVKRKGEYETRSARLETKSILKRISVFGRSPKLSRREISISVNGQIRLNKGQVFKKSISIKGSSAQNLYFVFAFFDVIRQDIEDKICFLSFSEIKNLSPAAGDAFSFETDFSGDAGRDKYSNFIIDKKDLAQKLLNIIK